MPRTYRSPISLLILLLFCQSALAAAPPAGMAPAANAVSVAIPPLLSNNPQLAPVLRHWDEQSILTIEVSRQPPQQVLDRQAMRRVQISSESGEPITLDKLYDNSFSAQRSIEQQLQRIPATAITGRVQSTEAVVEFPDRLLMLRQVRVVIRDPHQAAAAAPELAKFLAPVEQYKVAQARVAQLEPDVQQSLRRFIAEELTQREADDPLRQAMREGGEDALLRAMLSGVGEFEITDQVVIEHRPFNDGRLRLAPALKPMRATATPLTVAPLPPIERQTPLRLDPITLGGHPARGTSYRYPVGEQREGRHEFSENFLAGFTLGHELAWERRWNFSGNFLRINYGIGYGIGLRVPIIVDGRLQPTQSTRSAVDDSNPELTLRLSAKTADKGKPYYQQVGLAANQLFDGQEFVFTGGSWMGLKLHALGKDWLHISPINSPVQYSYDLELPLGGTASPVFTFEIPPELTNTELDFGVLSGALVIGVGLDGIGSIALPYSLLVDSEVISSKLLHLQHDRAHTETMHLPAVTASPRTITRQSYGLHLGAPSYLLQANAAARLKLEAKAEIGPLKRNFDTDWFTVFSMPIGQVIMPPHAGTRSSYTWQEGLRIFEARDPGDPASVQTPRVVPPLR